MPAGNKTNLSPPVDRDSDWRIGSIAIPKNTRFVFQGESRTGQLAFPDSAG